MCIVYISVSPTDKSVVIAANRDEFHARPSLAIHRWQDHPNIIAGRDLQAGGTWLGWADGNKFAFLTNYREPILSKPNQPSRGDLVKQYLAIDQQIEYVINNILNTASDYAGFNLVLGNLEQSWYITNRYTDASDTILNLATNKSAIQLKKHIDDDYQSLALPLQSGHYVISNHLINTPWPKSARLCTSLSAITNSDFVAKSDTVFNLLHDTTQAPASQLPNTGNDEEFEQLLSSPFIISKDYGTRCSSILVLQAQQGFFSEISYNNQGIAIGQQQLFLNQDRNPAGLG